MLVGVNIGGTFTDIVAVLPDGSMISVKLPSTPTDFSISIHEGLHQLFAGRGDLGPVGQINHGTTVATNCVLENKGARTDLITTTGFRDVLEIGRVRVRVPLIYDLDYAKPEPLVERLWHLETNERMVLRVGYR